MALLTAAIPGHNALAQWTGGVEAGTQLGSGDSPTLRFFARENSLPFTQLIYLDWTRDSGEQSFRVGYDPRYQISQSLHLFGKFSVEEDAETIIDQKLDALVGVGNDFIQTRNSRLTLEIGAGGQQLRFDGDLEAQTDSFLFLGANYYRTMLDLFRFTTTVGSRTGELRNSIDAEAGISIRIAPNTALKYAYRYRRTEFSDDNIDTVVDEDNFFTVTYGF